MTFEKLKEEIIKRTTLCEIFHEDNDFLGIKNGYGENLVFYSNGYVKSYGDCRFLLDELGYYIREGNWWDDWFSTVDYNGHKGMIIGCWNKEEKCGYWKVPG